MPRTAHARQVRAPPLHAVLRVPRGVEDEAACARRHLAAARKTGWVVGAAWAASLWVVLSWLGRVPWPEAAAWSVASGLMAGRGVQAGVHRWLRRWLAPAAVELGPPDAPQMRRRVGGVLRRRGYRLRHHDLGHDLWVPRWALLGAVRIEWAGAGCRMRGPRRVVRALVKTGV